MQEKINPILGFWVTPKLPAIHLSDKVSFINKYFFHPVKRRIAKYYLAILKSTTNIKVIAITGSAGKTTTKEMLASILSLEGKTVFSKANIDPVYNIPTTILKVSPGTKYLILEMGVEYPGEMDFYLWLAKPDIGIITNIFPTHTEFLKDIKGVFEEKSKMVRSLEKGKIAILNSSDKYLLNLSGKLKAKIIWYKSVKNPFDSNALAAETCAVQLGAGKDIIKEGLEKYQNPPHRLEIIRHKSGSVILDDSYNSNPWAAISTLEYFNGFAKGKKIAVLGDMLELGSYDEEGHRLLGREVAKSKFDTVIGVGKSSAFLIEEINKLSKTKTILIGTWQEALPKVRKLLGRGTYVLVKGSRSIGLNKLVDSLS